jgi:small-conductance mechanosensitive channel
MSEFLSRKLGAVQALLLGIPPAEWLIAGIVGAIIWAALWILRDLIASRYKKYSSVTNPTLIRLIAYLIGNTKQILFFAVALDVARMLIWSLLILVALDNLGVNITALLAGLGVGGVAVALALQNVLGDLFASLSIALDKPFVIGDNLTIDTFVGKVEHIGINTTRLRSESGEQIIRHRVALEK